MSYFNVAGDLVDEFAPVEGTSRGLAIVAADLDADGFDEIVVGRTGTSDEISLFDGSTHELLAKHTFGPVVDRSFGIRLGVLRSTGAGDMLLVGNAPGSAVAVSGYDDLSGEPVMLPLELANRAFGIFLG